MKARHPTASEERWLVLALRYPSLRPVAETEERSGGWRTSTLRSRCLFFFLGVLGAGMGAGSMALFPAPLLCGGLLLIGAAEYLIARRRAFRSGIEEALMVCGALALAGQFGEWTGFDDSQTVLVFAVALGLAGFRLGSFPFTTLAVLAVSVSIGLESRLLAAVSCAGVAVLALIVGGSRFERPSIDRMIDGLIVTLPIAGSVWMMFSDFEVAALVLPVVLAPVWAIVGLRRRSHAPLIATLGLIPCIAFALHDRVGGAEYWHLIAWAVVVLGSAIAAERVLRRARGLTSRNLRETDGVLDLIEAAAVSVTTAGVQPAHPATATPSFEGEGGGFGGGGASGRF